MYYPELGEVILPLHPSPHTHTYILQYQRRIFKKLAAPQLYFSMVHAYTPLTLIMYEQLGENLL